MQVNLESEQWQVIVETLHRMEAHKRRVGFNGTADDLHTLLQIIAAQLDTGEDEIGSEYL